MQKIFCFYRELFGRTLDFQQNYGTLRLSLTDSITRRAFALLLAALFIWLMNPHTSEFCITRSLVIQALKIHHLPRKKWNVFVRQQQEPSLLKADMLKHKFLLHLLKTSTAGTLQKKRHGNS